MSEISNHPETSREVLYRELHDARERSRVLEPSCDERRHWEKSVNQQVGEFISHLSEARTFAKKSLHLIEDFDRKIKACTSLGDIIQTVTEGISGSGLLTAGPGHLGFVPGGGLILGALADHLASALNPFSADDFAAPIATHIHNQAIRWLCDLVGYGQDSYGDLTSGGSIATLTALTVARKATQIRSQDIPSLCVYVGEHTHHCVDKALDTLFGHEIHIRKVSSQRMAMDQAALQKCIESDLAAGLRPWLVVATAGSTNLGRVDPLADIARVAHDYGLWLHVDAAYGGFFKLVPEVADLFIGMEQADSIVLDPHKGLFLPYGSGAVLVKNGALLRHHTTGAYLQDRDLDLNTDDRSPMDHSLELTRPFRALRLWLILIYYGKDVLRAALREKRILATYCAEELATIPHITLVAEPDLSILAFKFTPNGNDSNEGTSELLRRINTHPEVFLSSTKIGDQMVIRVAILSFRTHMETVEKLLEIVTSESTLLVQERGIL